MKIKRMLAMVLLIMAFAVVTTSMTVFAVPVESTTAPAAPATTQTTVQPTEAVAPTLSPNAITPNGQGSVLNYYENEDDDKQFYTITTPAGNVFYLVVDGARGYENVYFLNAVTENDLMALAAENDKITITNTPASQTATEGQEHTAATKDEADAPEKPKKDGGNDMMMYIVIGAAFLVVAGIGIYMKVIRPKKDKNSFDGEESEDSGSEYYGGYDDTDDYGSPEYIPEDDLDEE